MSDFTVSATLRLKIAAWSSDLTAAERRYSRFIDRIEGDTRQAAERISRVGSTAGRSFAAQGGQAGDQFVRDAIGRLASAQGRAGREGEAVGRSAGSGFRRGLSSAGASSGILSSFAGLAAGSHGLFLIAGGAGAAVAGLQLIPPVVAAIGGALGAIPSVASAAMASIAAIGLGTHGIGSAIGEIWDPPAGGGGGGSSGIDQTAAATRRLSAAQRDAKVATQDVTRARQEEARSIRDVSMSLDSARISEREALQDRADALLALQDAERRNDPKSIERYQLAYDRTNQSVLEAQVRVKDLSEDKVKADQLGVEGSDRVQAALRRQEDAAGAVIDAQEALAAATTAGGGAAAAAATAYDKLSPNAKKFVDEVRKLKPELDGLQQFTQDRVFAHLGDDVGPFAQVMIPQARRALGLYADDWNHLIRITGRSAMQPTFLNGVNKALDAGDRFFDKFNSRIPAFMGTLGRLSGSGSIFFDRFGDSIMEWADRFNAAVARAEQTGNLDEFFADAAEQADALVDIGGELIRMIVDVGAAGQDATILRDIADWLRRFNEEAHNSQDIAGIIATGNAALKGMASLLMILGSALAESLADPDTRQAVETFFKILGASATVLATLVDLFNALPGPVQSTILVLLALNVVWGRLSVMGGQLGASFGRVTDRLDTMGPAGQRASRGLSGLATVGGRALGVFAGLQVAGALLSGVLSKDLHPSLATATKDLAQWQQGMKLSGEAARLFGEDTGKLKDAFNQVDGAAPQWLFGMSGPLVDKLAPDLRKDVNRWGNNIGEFFNLGHLDESKQIIESYDAVLADMARSGNGDKAAAMIQEFSSRTGRSVGEITALLPGYRDALAAVTEQTAAYYSKADEAARINDLLTQSFEDLHGGAMGWAEAEINVEDALDNLIAALDASNGSLDATEPAGRRAMQALLSYANATVAAMSAKLKETGSTKDAITTYQHYYQELVNAAMQAGKTKKQAQDLAAEWLKLPRSIEMVIHFRETGLWGISRGISGLLQGFAAILKIDPAKLAAAAGRRWGGVVEHAATGRLRDAAVYRPGPSPLYAFAERETEGEAFVPKRGNPGRSLGILEHAANWYDHVVVPKQLAMQETYGRAMSASVDYGRPLPASAYGAPAASAGPSPEAYAQAMAAQLAPMLAGAASVTVLPIADSHQLALLVRKGEQDDARRG